MTQLLLIADHHCIHFVEFFEGTTFFQKAKMSKSELKYKSIICRCSHLFGKFFRFYFYKSRLDSFHEGQLVIKSDTTASNGILELVSINTRVDNTTKQIIHYMSKRIYNNKEDMREKEERK